MHFKCRALTNKGMHTFLGMLGYIQKDKMFPHYKLVLYNVTQDVRFPALPLSISAEIRNESMFTHANSHRCACTPLAYQRNPDCQFLAASPQELDKGVDIYSRFAAGPLKYVTMLSPTNCFQKMAAYWRITKGGAHCDVPNLLRDMIRTGKFQADPKWIMQARFS